MNTLDFLTHLRALDILVSAKDGKLLINGPKGAVTSDIQSELRARKEEILSLLSDFAPVRVEQQDDSSLLSLAQEHLWQLHRLLPDTAAYNMYAVIRLRGVLRVPALESAISSVVDRHKLLRAFFSKSETGEPLQMIAPVLSIVLRKETLQGSDNSQKELQTFISEEIQAPFDLSSGPLFRPTLVAVGRDEHILILVMHHIISDGHSFRIIYEDMARAYQAALKGSPPDWSPLPLQFADYAVWQRKWLASNDSYPDRIYWREHLSGIVPALELPFDHPHPLQTKADGNFVGWSLDAALHRELNEFCRRKGVTLFTVALAAFNVLLHRYSGQDDLLICTPVAARDRAEFSDLVGYFNNTLLLRTDLSEIRTFQELLSQTQVMVSNALVHQMFPFKEAAGFPNLTRTPLSRAMLMVQESSRNVFQLPEIEVELLPVFNNAVQYDLAVEVSLTPEGIEGRFMYRLALFDYETVESMAEAYVAILNEIVTNENSIIYQDDFLQQAKKKMDREVIQSSSAPPHTALERQLAQIWQEVLEVDQVGIHDEFFALGGHSLLALRLFTRIEQETGTYLPLSSLFETTTISHLANLIEGKQEHSSWDCLVPIKPDGNRPPLFLVHGIGGGILGYRDLANTLAVDQPVIGLQAVGQDGLVPYDLSIKEMAARYINAMRSYHPEGPYRIGGYCFGGVVAFEMACQLEKIGQAVSLLAIFEGGIADAMETKTPLAQRLRVILSSIPVWVRDYASMPPGKIRDRMLSTLQKLGARLLGNPYTQRKLRVEETLDIDISDLTKSSIELTEVHLKAALEFIPEEYGGNITVFRARNRSINEVFLSPLDPKMGWGALTKGMVNVIPVDGFHRNMHLEPYVKSLAEELTKQLNSARQGPVSD